VDRELITTMLRSVLAQKRAAKQDGAAASPDNGC